jgi:DNA-binding LacI/PurR family transcriptional regulator
MEKNSPSSSSKVQRKKTAARSPLKRVSSRDVARHAGVSQTTVSFVLSGRNDVSIPEETRQRVFTAATQLGYLRSHLASGLLRGRTQSVGVVMLSWVYPWMIFTGIQTGLARADYVPVLLSSSWSEVYSRGGENPAGYTSDEIANIHRLIEQQVDGLIYYSIDETHTEACLGELTRRKIPVVLIDNDCSGAGIDFVGCDDDEVGRLAARHLLSLDRRSFGLARHSTPFQPGRLRVAGFVAELKAARRKYRVFEAKECQGEELPRRLLDLLKPPAAVFACNDLQAAVVLRAARMIGWRVPEDLAIVGVGGFQISEYTNPPITTVHRPAHDIGLRAAELLLDRLNGYDGPSRRVIFPPSLEIREST